MQWEHSNIQHPTAPAQQQGDSSLEDEYSAIKHISVAVERKRQRVCARVLACLGVGGGEHSADSAVQHWEEG